MAHHIRKGMLALIHLIVILMIAITLLPYDARLTTRDQTAHRSSMPNLPQAQDGLLR